MKLIGTAFVVTIEKDDFWPDCVFRPGVEVFDASEADEMLLESLPFRYPDVLLFGADGQPALVAHSIQDGRCW